MTPISPALFFVFVFRFLLLLLTTCYPHTEKRTPGDDDDHDTGRNSKRVSSDNPIPATIEVRRDGGPKEGRRIIDHHPLDNLVPHEGAS